MRNVDEKSEMKPWLAHLARVDSLLPEQKKSLLHSSNLFIEMHFFSKLIKIVTSGHFEHDIWEEILFV